MHSVFASSFRSVLMSQTLRFALRHVNTSSCREEERDAHVSQIRNDRARLANALPLKRPIKIALANEHNIFLNEKYK